MKDGAVVFGHPALRELFWLKLKGGVRAQTRRLRRPSSWLFLLVGFVLLGVWIASFVLSSSVRARVPLPAEMRLALAQTGILALVALTLIGAFSYRGLYLPKEEIELVFSAPLSRRALIRYRLGTSVVRGAVTGLFFGAGAALRAPHAVFGFLGMLVTMLTVPILGQAAALLLGDAENRLGKLTKRLPLRRIAQVLGIALVGGIAWLFMGVDDLARELARGSGENPLQRLVAHPLAHAVLLPFTPWARTIVASSASEFWPWFLFCAGFALVAHEACARIAVDFRELSLVTSADVAKRLSKMRRGGFAAAHDTPARTGSFRRVPWLFGSSGFGAVAWLKVTAIVRKSRMSVVFSALLLAILVIASAAARREAAVVGVAFAGTFYLCLGLRLDFRADLELMDRIKVWPLAPWKIFLATILPEVALVSALVMLATTASALATDAWSPHVVALIAAIPPLVLTWSALDNAVFLFMPVRFTPGQEGALQHVGRSVLMMLARLAMFAVLAAVAAGPAALAAVGAKAATGSDAFAFAAAALVGLVGVAFVCGALVWGGGRLLARFDVARDKPV